jgi:flagellin FlaB
LIKIIDIKDGLVPMVRDGLKMIASRFHNEKSGITGLETAIVLIAFVVVAAVFAFTVLTTGLFTSEKAKETALAGVATTSSSLTVKGNVIAQTDAAGAAVNVIRLKLATATGVERVEFIPDNMIITYLDDVNVAQLVYPGETPGRMNGNVDGPIDPGNLTACLALADPSWCYKRDGDDELLDPGEIHELYLIVGPLAPKLTENRQFTVEIIPQDGAVVRIERRTPISLTAVMNLN